ncbi:MAG: pitrilysin family protein [Methylacidiphilales bacterium]|nr:pitrilysin family protein [Candidatus Methylacidiphilales bacterium]
MTDNSKPTSSVQLERPAISKYVLPNGLTLLVQEDHSAPVVSMQAWCAAGSTTEGKYLGCGISHILEHMLFKGTERRGNSEIALALQNVGGYVNAYTSVDRTVFHVDLPSAGWKTALDVLTDAIFHSTLPVDQYSKEQEVIRREFAMSNDNPGNSLSKLLFATAFAVHPYKYPVIGHLELYNKLTREDVLEYYHKYYVPNNLTFVIAGDVNPEEVKTELDKLTTGIERKPLEAPVIPDEPAQLARREDEKPFPTDTIRMAMSYHTPGITDPDAYALDLLAVVAGDGDSSRFNRDLVENKKMLRSVDVFSYTPGATGLWAATATFHPGSTVSTAEVESEITRLLEEFKNTPIGATELEKAKRKALADRAAEGKTMEGEANSLGNNWFVARDVYFSDTYLQKLQQVTAADLQSVARKYFTPGNLTVVRLVPESSAKAPIATTAKSKSSELEQVALKNGAPLVLKKDNKVPLFTVRAIVRGGLLVENAKDSGIGKLMLRLLDKGTTHRSAEQIADEIENLGGSIQTEFGNNTFSLSIEVLEPDARKAMDLLSDMLLNPVFPDSEFQKEKVQQLADIKLEQDKPLVLAGNALKANLYGPHPYGRNSLGTAETLASITREDVVRFYKNLWQPRSVVFAAGGSFDRDALVAAFEKSFPPSVFGASAGASQNLDVAFQGRGQDVLVATPKQQAIVEIGFPGCQVDSPDRPALEIINEALSDLGSRLFIRIREKQSLAYFVGTNQMLGVKPGYFIFYAGTEASKGEKVRSELLDEIHNIATGGLTEAEVSRARAKLVGSRLMESQTAPTLAYKGGLNVLYGLGLNYEDQLNARIAAITLQEVNQAAAKYFSGNNFVCVIVKPQAKP